MERVRRAELLVSILLGAALVGAIVYAAWATLPGSSGPSSPYSPTPAFVVLPQNTSFVLQPAHERVYTYTNTTASNYLAGLFNVTPVGDCGSPCFLFPGIFLMTPAQFSTFLSGGLDGYISGALYASNVSIFARLAPGTYYLVFWNHEDLGISNLSLRFAATMPFDGYNASAKPPVPPSPTPRRTVVSSQDFTIGDAYNGGAWWRFDVTLSPTYWNYSLSGAFSVSGGTTTLYIFTPTQFTALSSSFGAVNMPSTYPAVFALGPSSQASFNASVPAGNYILVFTNNNVTPGSGFYPSIVVDLPQNVTASPA